MEENKGRTGVFKVATSGHDLATHLGKVREEIGAERFRKIVGETK